MLYPQVRAFSRPTLVFAYQSVVELPGSGNVQDIGFHTNVGGERGERRCEMDDADRGIIDQLVTGRTQDRHVPHGTVLIDRYIEHDISPQSAPFGFLRVVQISD